MKRESEESALKRAHRSARGPPERKERSAAKREREGSALKRARRSALVRDHQPSAGNPGAPSVQFTHHRRA